MGHLALSPFPLWPSPGPAPGDSEECRLGRALEPCGFPSPRPGPRRSEGPGLEAAPQPGRSGRGRRGHPAPYLGEECLGGVSLRSLQPASRAAAQDRAQPGRALLPALLPPRPLRPPPSLPPFFLLLLFLLLLSGLQPSFLSARPYLWGTFSISLTQGLPASPSAGAGPTPRRGQISKRQRCPRGGASACRAESRRGADVRAPRGRRGGGRTAQGVFLTGGRGSSCRAGRPHPTRRPRRARPGVPARGAAPAARGPSSRRPSSVARPPPRRPARL